MKPMLKQNKAFNFFILLFAFLCGNLFILTYSNLNWGLLLIFSVIFLLEFLTQFLYSRFFLDLKKQQNQLLGSPFRPPRSRFEDQVIPKMNFLVWLTSCFGTREPNSVFIFINTLKRGFLLGFFIEAFKVGS